MYQARERSSLAHDSSHKSTMGLGAGGRDGNIWWEVRIFLWPTPRPSTIQGLPQSLPVYRHAVVSRLEGFLLP